MFGINRKASPRKRRSFTRKPSSSSLLLARRPSGAVMMATPSKGGPACSNIRVLLRVRPATGKEQDDQRCWRDVVEVVDKSLVIFDPKEEEDPFFLHGKKQAYRDITKRQRKNLQFNFDHVFGPEECTADVYSKSIQSLIASLLNGYNCSVFAYGATGSGKTHTMLGSPESPGVTPLLMRELYATLAQLENSDVNVVISYLEIYNEAVHDLLVDQGQVRLLQLREKDDGSVIVPELSWHTPASAEDLMAMLQLGNQRRTQHPTDANAESSRSHAVFQVVVKTKRRSDSRADKLCCAKLSMIDLAGSERAAATNNNRPRFTEGANINKSLLALGNCINALADGQKHVPFRNSKLTRLLKGSLGGNCQTVMIANVSPSSHVYEDTYNTLKYATRAKKIKNRVKKNLVSMDITAAEYSRVIEEAQVEISTLKAQNAKLVAENLSLRAAAAAGTPLDAVLPVVVAGVPAATLTATLAVAHLSTPPSAAALAHAAAVLSAGDTPPVPLDVTVAAADVSSVTPDQELALRTRILELEAQVALLHEATPSPVTAAATPLSPVAETESALVRVTRSLEHLNAAGTRLEEATESRLQLQAQLDMLDYNFERKKLKIDRVNELKKDSTQTKLHSLEVKTLTQRASLQGRLLATTQREDRERACVHAALLELQREAEGAWGDFAKSVIPFIAVKFELKATQLQLQNLQCLLGLQRTDLASMHDVNMRTAILLHKTFYVLKALGSTSPDMEDQYETIVNLTRRIGNVTFQKTPEPQAEEPEEVMAEPLNATFCIPPPVVVAPASSRIHPAAAVVSTASSRVLASSGSNRIMPPPPIVSTAAKKSRLTPPTASVRPSMLAPRSLPGSSSGTPATPRGVVAAPRPSVTSAGRRKRTPLRNNYKKFKKVSIQKIAFNKENKAI